MSRRRRTLLTCLLAAAQCLPHQVAAQLPALGDGLEMSVSSERRLGDRIVRQLYRSPDYLDDAILGEYVQGIWQRLTQAARQRGELSTELEERFAWEVLLGRDPTLNAFALPGGYLGVHLGLIAGVSSADELASVLAHELSHVTQRHIARIISRQSDQAPWLLGAMILGALAASSNPDAAGAMIAGGQAAAVQGQLNFSRDMEREADRVGYSVMTQAGYEPQGFVSMFEKLQQANRFNDSGSFAYLRSHPLTTERIADMQARQQLLPQAQPPGQTVVHAMLAARARMLANPEVDSRRSALAEAEAPASGRLPVARQAGVLYAGVLAASGMREFDRARALQARLLALVQRDSEAAQQAQLLGAELLLAAGDIKAAREKLLTLANRPEAAGGRARLFLLAQAQTRSAQARQAAEQLQLWLASRPRDAQAWQLLAAAYTAQGQTLRAVRAEAEVHAAHLDYEAALNRLRAAQELARAGAQGDHIEASIIDTRRREVELQLREQALER